MEADIITVGAGDLLLGARANDAVAERWLRDLLAPVVVAEPDVLPYPNVSVALGEDQRVGRGLHLLLRGLTRELRTTSMGRVLRAVPAHLDGWLPPPDGFVRCSARVLASDAGALLVDRHYDDVVERAARRLLRKGWRLVDTPFADLDPATLDVVLRPPRVEVDPGVAARLDVEHPPGSDEVPLDGRRLPVRAVVASRHPAAFLAHPSSGAAALASFAITVGDHQRFRLADLEALARLLAQGVVEQRDLLDEGALLGIAAGLG